jgi:hypothetical protein
MRKSIPNAENHDAFEWLIIHVVIPNTVAATQPRLAGAKASDSSTDIAAKSSSTSRWRGGSSTLLEKLRSDFNGTSKNSVDRVAQVRIGINDVPYDLLPRVVPAVPTGYTETEQDAENAWADLVAKFKALILSSFDLRVRQYEEDIKEKDAQRSLPGWNLGTNPQQFRSARPTIRGGYQREGCSKKPTRVELLHFFYTQGRPCKRL